MFHSKLRPYQLDALGKTVEAIASGQRSGLWIMPTGTGKTLTFTQLASALRLPTLILVHRNELIEQTIHTFHQLRPMLRIGVVKAQRNEWDGYPIVVASVQSMNVSRLEKIPADRFGLVIADEAHHTPAPSWTRAINYFDRGFLLGVTATPDRLDGLGLGSLFGSEPVFSYQLPAAIRDGWLVPIRQYAIETKTDLDAVAIRAGDFAEGQLADTVNTLARNQTIVEAYQKHADQRRAICFCVDVQHSFDLALVFNEAGVSAACVTGNMDSEERAGILKRFMAGGTRVLTNCEILTEGFDDPDIECIIMARPTKSRALYTQCVGRGLRLPRHNRAKKDCLVLDITDNCRKHKLVTACKLMGLRRDDADGGELLGLADEEEKEEQKRQEHIRDHITGPVVWRLESVCPWPALPSLDGYRQTSPWQLAEPSEKQLHALKKFGLQWQRELTRGEVSYLLDQAFAYEEAFPMPATNAQAWRLRLEGKWVEGMSKREASRIIGQLMDAKKQAQPKPEDVPQ